MYTCGIVVFGLWDVALDLAPFDRARGRAGACGRNAAAMACFHRAGFDVLGRVELFTELREGLGDRWKPGVTLHGLGFRS